MGRQRRDAADTVPVERTCVVCGRRIEWRAKWARDWDQVRYCSDGCRTRGARPVDAALESAITDLLAQRPRGATICPSEAARAVAARAEVATSSPDAWRALMEPARAAARRLVSAGEVEVTQGGRVVDPSTAKGPIRLRSRR